MPDFDAQVRTSYRDVTGLVLSCDRNDIVEDSTNPGFVREWINRAPGLPSQPVLRVPGDPPPTYLGGRFSNPKQLDQALQPTLAGPAPQRVQFDRARSTFLETEFLAEDLPDVAQPLACGFQFTQGGDAALGQIIFTMSAANNFAAVRRTTGAGDGVIACGAAFTTVAGDLPTGTYVYTAEAGGTAIWQQDGGAFGAGAANATVLANGTKLFIGQDFAGGNFLDGTLDTINLWMGELSPATLDFIWQSINQDGNNFESDLRAPAQVPNVVWTDVTGDLSLNQYNRLNPILGVPFRYIRFDLPAAPALHRIQLAAAVEGIVLPDAQLGGELFTWTIAESPTTMPVPLFVQDAGWSAVADIEVNGEGHYTIVVTRDSGGSMILHLDVQVAP